MRTLGTVDDRLVLERAEALLRERGMLHAEMCCAAVREELLRLDVEALGALILTAQRSVTETAA